MSARLDDDFTQFVNLSRRPEPEDIVRVVMLTGALLVGAFMTAMLFGLVCMVVVR